MNAEEALSWIVEEVIRRLQSRRKRALVIFTGGAIGYKEAIPQVKSLIKDGWNLRILLSNSAEYVLTPQLVKDQLEVDEVIVESEVKGLRPLYGDVNYFIIPTLTLNSAVKIAIGIADTLVTNLVAHGIMEGISIIAAKDACDLKNSTRLNMGMNKTPAAYLSVMEEYLNRLEAYGIKLVDAEDLYKATIEEVNYSYKNQHTGKATQEFTKKVLSRTDIIKAKEADAVLYVNPSTIVTSLAHDTAREIGVKILQK
ncbi:flavoprotein [Alkaliphilus peptidifermentans]|uniref:Flavoprotein n=1 Tax=Alkaliphilus peptidifermentans DSM 18978 TaxID=1120976 RepID=A0A1G5AAY3_9FIRM|nr:flavoprotein [Alkaliphilus peptidifermentans]SCX75032.1 Flavoprotein [Alkaliphilus peptidifermentans DSM 18978]